MPLNYHYYSAGQIDSSFYDWLVVVAQEVGGWSADRLAQDQEFAHHHYAFFSLAGQPLAVLNWTQVFDSHDIHLVYVDPAYRQQGLAHQLMGKYLSTIEPGDQLLLEVRQSNHPAIALYEGLGFKEISRRKNYYPGPEDALIMSYRKGNDLGDK